MKETNQGSYTQEMKDKAEKIVAALHVLTSHFDDTEFLKSSIRSCAMTFLVHVLGDKDIQDEVNKLSSFIRVAMLSQQIKKENGELILQELVKVNFEKSKKDIIENIMDTQHATTLPSAQKTLSAEEQKVTSFTLAQQSPTPTPRERMEAYKETLTADRSSFKTDSVPSIKATPSFQKDDTVTLTPRRQKVISLLSKTDTKSIRDISRHFNDCSEKTIQRELNDMVESNIIIRVGDRRWSTYKLA